MEKLKKIRNNTDNSVIINGTYIGPKSDTILSEEVVNLIDRQYFIASILIDDGYFDHASNELTFNIKTIEEKNTEPKQDDKRRRRKSKKDLEVTTNDDLKQDTKEASLSIDSNVNEQQLVNQQSNDVILEEELLNALQSFYKKPPMGIPLSHLDSELKSILEKAKRIALKEEISKNETSSESTTFSTEALDGDNSVSELELLEELKAYYKKPVLGIPLSHLDEEVTSLLQRAKRAVVSKQINLEDLSPELQNIIMSSDPSDSNGDGQADFLNGSGGTADIINNGTYIPIKESSLDKEIIDKLQKATTAYQKPENGIPISDLDPHLKEILDQQNLTTDFWLTPVESSDLLPMVDNKPGDIRLVLKTNTLWRWDDIDTLWKQIGGVPSGSETPTLPMPNPYETHSVISEFFAYEGQQNVNFEVSYPVGYNILMIWVNGVLVNKGELYDYVEVNDHSVRFNYPLQVDDYVVCALSTTTSHSLILTQVADITARIRQVRLKNAYNPGTGSLRVFLNGIQLKDGTNDDYIEVDTRTVEFNIDLLPGDRIAFRIETNTYTQNITNQVALMRQYYVELANKVKDIQKHLPKLT